MKKGIALLAFLLLTIGICHAQYTFSGTVLDAVKGEKMKDVQVALTAQDTLVSLAITDSKGEFCFYKIPDGEYIVHIDHPGYTSLENGYAIRQDTKVTFSLQKEMNITLDSVVITANQSDRVERTATGLIFHLSEQAKNSGNPFKALREIPQLISNEANQSVQMEDGSFPLILINGNQMNSGIAPIDPKEIEAVEIVNVVNARYLKDGVQSILNIKLKKKTKPYLYFEAMNRHNFPLNRGMGAIHTEIGNPKFSLYGRIAGEYLYHDDDNIDNWQKNVGYIKESNGTRRTNGNNILGELLFKWQGTPKDYFAAHLYAFNKYNKSKAQGDGTMQTDNKQPFDYHSHYRDESYIMTASLYHKHSFADNKTIETTLAYNKNLNKDNGEQNEYYPDWAYTNYYEYRNTRNSGKLNIDYTYEFGKNSSWYIGSVTNFLNDRIKQVSGNVPVFHHRQWDEYLYSVISGKIDKLFYMFSVGVEGIWLKAGDASNHYFRPRGAMSGTYSFNDNNSVRIGYTLSNTTPSVAMLNPYNVSTDSLIVTKGNPLLTPVQNHSIRGSYTFNRKGLYLTPSINYVFNKDEIEACGYNENGIYTSSYQNSSNYQALILRMSLSYRTKWGRVYGQLGHAAEYFKEQQARKSFLCAFGITAWYKKISFNMDCSYNNYTYTAVSKTKYHTPDYSLLQVTYNITPQLYISTALEYITGALSTDTYTYSGNYQSRYSLERKDKNLRPWVLIRYTLRKNKERKIKLNNILESTEEGISLKK